MEGEQRRAKTEFNATTDILIIEKMVTQLYDKSYFTWLGEWMNAPTYCIAGVLELCEQLTPIEDYLAFKNGTSTDNDVTCRLFSKSSESLAHILAGCSRLTQTKYLERQRCNKGANERSWEQCDL